MTPRWHPGSIVIWSAVLSVKWLGRTLRSFHYWSILMVTVAVALVGLAGIQKPDASDDDVSDGSGSGSNWSGLKGYSDKSPMSDLKRALEAL